MASGGTLLSDLDGKAPIAGDGDLVKMIYQDMNSGGSVGQAPMGTPMGGIQSGPINPMPPPQSRPRQIGAITITKAMPNMNDITIPDTGLFKALIIIFYFYLNDRIRCRAYLTFFMLCHLYLVWP